MTKWQRHGNRVLDAHDTGRIIHRNLSRDGRPLSPSCQFYEGYSKPAGVLTR